MLLRPGSSGTGMPGRVTGGWNTRDEIGSFCRDGPEADREPRRGGQGVLGAPRVESGETPASTSIGRRLERGFFREVLADPEVESINESAHPADLSAAGVVRRCSKHGFGHDESILFLVCHGQAEGSMVH